MSRKVYPTDPNINVSDQNQLPVPPNQSQPYENQFQNYPYTDPSNVYSNEQQYLNTGIPQSSDYNPNYYYPDSQNMNYPSEYNQDTYFGQEQYYTGYSNQDLQQTSQPSESYSQTTAQHQESDHWKKNKRVYPSYSIDPEVQGYPEPVSTYRSGSTTTDSNPIQQISTNMNQMSIGGPTSHQQMNQTSQFNNQYGVSDATKSVPPFEMDPLVSPSYQCPSLYMRMTTNVMANSATLLNKANIPMGCIIQPMAESKDKEPIPVVNFGISEIVRCRRCRAYINPFVTFTDGGRRWRCNLCNLSNEVPSDYMCPLDNNGRRTDADSRPELSKGCVEFVAPGAYMVRPPQPPSYFFVIDSSFYSNTSGMFYTTIQTIKQIINDFPGDGRTRIGFLTFDSSLHFYNLKSSLSQPQMLVVSDLNDIFLPLPNNDMLVNLQESKEMILSLLDKLPTMFESTQKVDVALGPALKAASEIVKHVGGKLLVFANSIPSIGVAKLKNRDDPKLLGTDNEKNLLLPENNYYKDFALDCSRLQISIDLFLFSGQYTDVATLGTMPQYSSGQLYYYPAFKAEVDGEKLYWDIVRNVTRETGWEAVMRVRASKGVKVSNHYGNFFIRSTDLLALPNVDADKAFAIQLAHEDTINQKYVSLQCALLYTTSSGERRIRCFTQCLPVTTSISEIFRNADSDAITTLTTKMAIEKALTSKLSDAREALVNKCIEILSSYRQNIAPGTSTQLVLPDSMKDFPKHILAIVKNVILRSGTDVRSDERSFYLMFARTFGIPSTILFLYPKLYPLHNLSEEVGSTDDNGNIILPPSLPLTSEKIDRNGAYLLDNGESFFIWISKQIDPSFIVDLFGGPIEGETPNTLPKLDTKLSNKIHTIIDALRQSHPGNWQSLSIIREGEPREIKFLNSYFVEDRTKAVHSYYEFLVNLHKRVLAKIQK